MTALTISTPNIKADLPTTSLEESLNLAGQQSKKSASKTSNSALESSPSYFQIKEFIWQWWVPLDKRLS